MMYIHIAFAGREPDPTLNTIKAIPNAIDRIVLLYSISDDGIYKKTAETLKEKLGEMNYTCESRSVKPFDFLNIVDTIYEVYEEYSKDGIKARFSVDITNGTNLMAAASCNIAFVINSEVYYMMDRRRFENKSLNELLVKIPSPKIPNTKHMGELTLKILRFIEKEQDLGNKICNADVAKRFGMKPQASMYHINRLLDEGAIELEEAYTPKGKIDKRKKIIKIKREGRFALRCV